MTEFSYKTRKKALQRFKSEIFDVLVVGGGITGAAVARDASSRGLKVALVERRDFAYGTSSRSSKLIHGGLRYLENFELKLVFEALTERTLLLKTAPHMVKPLPFYMPVYEHDKNGKFILSAGLWLYDLLTFLRTPGFHRKLSREQFMREVPFLKKDGLKGGFRYFDASMWDDVLAVETLRSAHQLGASIANYTEAMAPLWVHQRIAGFRVRDLEGSGPESEIDIRAHRVVVCAGPWTDELGGRLSTQWKPWLNPSKGVHLLFDLKRIPVPGALVMSHPQDGRIAFVIPRPDFGSGVVIVGTTDGPSARKPEEAEITPEDVQYLMDLLHRYFPDLDLKTSDILSAYVGVRPLVKEADEEGKSLQKVSREHHIDQGPGGSVVVAGGKYTTHRKMGEEIVDFMLEHWREALKTDQSMPIFPKVGPSRTIEPVNPRATSAALNEAKAEAARRGMAIPKELASRYGAEALDVVALATGIGTSERQEGAPLEDPEGFPMLEAQLRHSIRSEMTMHLEDFFLRRLPLYQSRADHSLPWARALGRVWADERGLPQSSVDAELARLEKEFDARSAWRNRGPATS